MSTPTRIRGCLLAAHIPSPLTTQSSSSKNSRPRIKKLKLWGPKSELPEDILLHILAALDVPDLVRAGCVCSAWRGAYSLCTSGWKQQQQTPCLLYTARSRGQRAACLYSLTEKRSYTLADLPDPPIRSRYLIGSAHGWIVTADELSELHLVNPITGDQVALPSITTMDEHVRAIYDDDDGGAVKEYHTSWWKLKFGRSPAARVHHPRKLRNVFFRKAFLSADPSTGTYIVVLISNTISQLSFARSGDDRWTCLPELLRHADVKDCIFKGETLYVLIQSGQIHAFDFSGPVVEQKLVLEKTEVDLFQACDSKSYIVQAPCGDLLQIWEDADYEGSHVSQPAESDSIEEDEYLSENDSHGEPYPCLDTRLQVYRVDLAAQKLVEIGSLDKNALFLGLSQSLCLPVEGYPQLLKENHVYFTDDFEYMNSFGKNQRRNIGLVNLSNNTNENVVSPEIWSKWPSPIWITPNPRKR